MLKKTNIIISILASLVLSATAYAGWYYAAAAAPGSSYLFEWAAENLTAETFDVTDGGTVTPDSDGTPSYFFVTGHTNNAIQLTAGTWVLFPATQGHNIDWGHIHISFYMAYVSGDFDAGSYLVTTPYESPLPFALRCSTTSQVLITYGGVSHYINVSEDLSDLNFHFIDLDINCSAQTIDLSIDSSSYSDTLPSTTVYTPASQVLHINGFNGDTSNQTIVIDEFKIQ